MSVDVDAMMQKIERFCGGGRGSGRKGWGANRAFPYGMTLPEVRQRMGLTPDEEDFICEVLEAGALYARRPAVAANWAKERLAIKERESDRRRQ